MSSPNKKLTVLYGNEDVYRAKLAGFPGIANVLWGLHLGGRSLGAAKAQRYQEQEAEMMNAALRRFDAQRMAAVTEGARSGQLMRAFQKTAALMALQDVERAKLAAGGMTQMLAAAAPAAKKVTQALSSVPGKMTAAMKAAPAPHLPAAPHMPAAPAVPRTPSVAAPVSGVQSVPGMPKPAPAAGKLPSVSSPSPQAGLPSTPTVDKPNFDINTGQPLHTNAAFESLQARKAAVGRGPASTPRVAGSRGTLPSFDPNTGKPNSEAAVANSNALHFNSARPNVDFKARLDAPVSSSSPGFAAAGGDAGTAPKMKAVKAPAPLAATGPATNAATPAAQGRGAPKVQTGAVPAVAPAPKQVQNFASSVGKPDAGAQEAMARIRGQSAQTPATPSVGAPVSPGQAQQGPPPTQPAVAPAPRPATASAGQTPQTPPAVAPPETSTLRAPGTVQAAPPITPPPPTPSPTPTIAAAPIPSTVGHAPSMAPPAGATAPPASTPTGDPRYMTQLGASPSAAELGAMSGSQAVIPSAPAIGNQRLRAPNGKMRDLPPATPPTQPSAVNPVETPKQPAVAAPGETMKSPTVAAPPEAAAPAGQAVANAQTPAVQTPAQAFEQHSQWNAQQRPVMDKRVQEIEKKLGKLTPEQRKAGAGNADALELTKVKKQMAEGDAAYAQAHQDHHGVSVEELQKVQQDAADNAAPTFMNALKRKASIGGALGAGALGLGAYGGYKLLNKGMDMMGAEGRESDIYGTQGGAPAGAINQYGMPQY